MLQHHASDRPVFVVLIFKNRHSQMDGRLVRIGACPHPATTALSGRRLARAAINGLPGDGAGHRRNIAVRWSTRTGPAEDRFAIFESSSSRLRKIEVENLRLADWLARAGRAGAICSSEKMAFRVKPAGRSHATRRTVRPCAAVDPLPAHWHRVAWYGAAANHQFFHPAATGQRGSESTKTAKATKTGSGRGHHGCTLNERLLRRSIALEWKCVEGTANWHIR